MLIMRKITRKKHLEMLMQSIPNHPKPKVNLEQYTTPAIISSDLLWNAFSLGDIEDKDVIDLGCGTGVFAIGSALLGAKSATGVDIDSDSIDLAMATSNKLKIDNASFIVSNINDLNEALNGDTIFQNPPFGSQKNAECGQDLNFIKKACELSCDVLYSFHMASTEEFLIKYYDEIGLEITHIFRYRFPIPKIYDFHTKESRDVDVIVIRALF